MAIVINGSGTVTGLAVGGLPDGTVDAGTLAANSVDSAELIDGAVDDSHIGALAASKLTGALPAISGASLTNLTSLFRVKLGGGNQSVSADTNTTITFDTTVVDTDSFFNTTTYTFQPTKAGWYYLNLVVRLHGDTDFTIYDVRVINESSDTVLNGSFSHNRYNTAIAAGLVYFNGSSNTARGVVYENNTLAVRSNYPDTAFEGFFIKE